MSFSAQEEKFGALRRDSRAVPADRHLGRQDDVEFFDQNVQIITR